MGWNSEERTLPKERCNKQTNEIEGKNPNKERIFHKKERILGKRNKNELDGEKKRQEKAVSIRMMKEDEIRKE